MKYIGALLALPLSFRRAIAASDQPRPRGVGPEFAKFYKTESTFTCISNPSIQLPSAQINDDYCDCPDGSDEPGTSACAYLASVLSPLPAEAVGVEVNTTIALPGFYCKNKGHRPSYLPFINVNDGVCDYDLCCDGSDEYDGVGGVKCEDRCKEIGKEWKKSEEQRLRSMAAADKKRTELVKEASRLRKEVEGRIQTLGAEIESYETKVANAERELQDIERQERGRIVRAEGNGGKIGVMVSLAKGRIDELRDSLSRVRQQRDGFKERIMELEDLLTKFREEYNPNYNDDGVKRAVRRWENYVAKDWGSSDDSTLDANLDDLLAPDSDNVIAWEEWDEGDDSEVSVLYKFEEYLPQPLRDWLDQKLRDLRLMLIENGILAGNSAASSESKAVTDAKKRLKTAETELNNAKKSLKSHKEDLEKDYGPDEVFRALKGQCVSQESGEYTYELCWMDKTTQKSRKGGGNTGMGNFARIEKVTVDEDVPSDGKGLGSGERLALKFENGQHCWNGPSRSTLVILACSEKDEIWKTTEQEKCVYRMEVGTPAVCEGSGRRAPANEKDEL